jgi:arabinofuranosyltransferase
MQDQAAPTPPEGSRARGGATAGMVVLALLFVAWAGTFVRTSSFVSPDGVRRYFLFDDAMISMRYAWNLAHGQGLVWNVGERVEGITNLLMTLYMAVWCSFLSKEAAVLAVQLSGIVFVLVTAFFSWRVVTWISRSVGADAPWLRLLSFAATLAYYPLAYWSLAGMETGLLAALVSASVWLAVSRGEDAKPSAGLAVLLGLAFLTRPDSAVVIAGICLYRAFRLRRQQGWWKTLVIEWGIVAAFVFGASVFRVLYYGHLTPNTYLLKVSGFPLAERLPNGLGFITPFLASTGLLLGFAVVMALVDKHRDKLLIVGLVLAATAYQVSVGGDPWPYWRQMAPVMPLLSGLLALEIARLFSRRWLGRSVAGALRDRPLSALAPALAILLTIVAVARLNAGFLDEACFRKAAFEAEDAHDNVDIALALRTICLPGATVGVSWAGAIPYYTGLAAVDFFGKSDPRIAALPPDLSGHVSWNGMKSVPGHNKYDLRYSIQERRPTYVQEYAWGRQNLREWVAEHYVSVRQGRALLCLAEDSPYVDWRRVSRERRKGCDEDVTKLLGRP